MPRQLKYQTAEERRTANNASQKRSRARQKTELSSSIPSASLPIVSQSSTLTSSLTYTQAHAPSASPPSELQASSVAAIAQEEVLSSEPAEPATVIPLPCLSPPHVSPPCLEPIISQEPVSRAPSPDCDSIASIQDGDDLWNLPSLSETSSSIADIPEPLHTNHPIIEAIDAIDSLTISEVDSLKATYQVLRDAFSAQCPCSQGTYPKGKSLGDMADTIARSLPRFVPSEESEHQPLSLPNMLNTYQDAISSPNLAMALSGIENDSCTPPTLDIQESENRYLTAHPTAAHLQRFFDIDSYIFSPLSLGVFKNDVEWSFLPPYTRGIQRNQRVGFEKIHMTQHKCMLLCTYDRVDCHVFFPNMPLEYQNRDGKTVKSVTQHPDDYTLEKWTDKVVIPAFQEVLDTNLDHYPRSFKLLRNKGNVKKEISSTQPNGRIDSRYFVPARKLSDLWDTIIRLAEHVQDAVLPLGTFANPTLVISSHNTKLSGLGSHSSFASSQAAFVTDFSERWNTEFIREDSFWVDIGQQIYSTQPGTTWLRKPGWNTHWASIFSCPSGPPRTRVTAFPWAGTHAGSVTVELLRANQFRQNGIAYNKAYNVLKEQFYTPLKDHGPFSQELFETLGYSKVQMGIWAERHRKHPFARSLQHDTLLGQWQHTKQRIYDALSADCEATASYSDRQEFRITLQLLRQLPPDLVPLEWPSTTAHRPFWILPTWEVNQFRLAECNRWVACMELLVQAASPKPFTRESIPVQRQDLNLLMSTAVARTLRFSLGCLNPQQLPSLWLGKRWSRGRGKNRKSTVRHYRQGLEYKDSVAEYGMLWLPHRLVHWNHQVPTFRIEKYRHLDIQHNILRSNSALWALSEENTREGRFRDFISAFARDLIGLAQQQQQQEEQQGYERTATLSYKTAHWTKLFVTLSFLIIQEYNLYVVNTVASLWLEKKGVQPAKRSRPSYRKECFARMGLSEHGQQGLEVLCYEKLRGYLRKIGVRTLLHARSGHTSSFHDWDDGTWAGRVRPLFNPDADSPTWLRNTTFYQRILYFEQVLCAFVARQEARQCCSAFRAVLHRLAHVYVQAILHYTKSKATTYAEPTSGHSQEVQAALKSQSKLERLKWMFPRIRSRHYERWQEAIATFTSSKVAIKKDAFSTMAYGWIVFAPHHEKDVDNARQLVRDASQLGYLYPNLRPAAQFHDDFELAEAARASDDEDSDWPENGADSGSDDEAPLDSWE